MTTSDETITALQEEIETAEKKRERFANIQLNSPDIFLTLEEVTKFNQLGAYIRGLQTAVNILKKEPARELEY